MKHILLLAFCLALSPLALTTGCGTSQLTSRAIAGRSLETVAVGVNGAMNTYGVLYRAGKVSIEQQADVRLKYTQYQASANTALRLLGTDKANAPIEVQALADDLIALIATFSTK